MASTVMSYSMTSMQLMNNAQTTSMPIMTNCNQMNQIIDDSIESCCSESCYCLSASCGHFFVLLPLINENITFVNQPFKIHSLNTLIQSTIPTSLYKPPITS